MNRLRCICRFMGCVLALRGSVCREGSPAAAVALGFCRNQGPYPETREGRMRPARRRVGFSKAVPILVGVLAAALADHAARAQGTDWPTRPIWLVVRCAAGGSSDAIGRIIADGIGSSLRQTVIVENVSGTGGLLGGAGAARGGPDRAYFAGVTVAH